MRRASAGVSLVQARLRRTLDGRRRMGEATDLLPAVLQEVVGQAGVAGATEWVLQGVHLSGTQVVVMMVGPSGEPATAVVKMPATPDGVASQRREAEAVTGLRATLEAGSSASTLSALIPVRLAEGEVGGVAYTVERAVPGVEGRVLLRYPSTKDKVVAAAAGVARELHRSTATRAIVGETLLRRWVDDRARLLGPATRNTAALERLERLLRQTLGGREVTTSWVHGDFWPANVIFDPDTEGERLAVSGVIDWEWAAGDELPAQDLLYLLLHMRMVAEGRELGPILVSLLTGDPLSAAERELLEPEGLRADRETILLVWLRHVAYNLIQSPSEARNWVWTSRNIDTVLHLL